MSSIQTHDRAASDPDRLIATSAAMRFVLQEITRAAERADHVLLSGEAGTGRQIIARAIHAQSRFSAGPFIVFDCAKRAPNDLEAQLLATSGNRAGVERRSLERVRRTAALVPQRVRPHPLISDWPQGVPYLETEGSSAAAGRGVGEPAGR